MDERAHIASEPMLFPGASNRDDAEISGFRFGARGTHTSRTIMLAELKAVLNSVATTARRLEYTTAIVDDNCTGKRTAATRRLTNQRLGELYGLDSSIQIFRVLRHLWEVDAQAHPLLALLCAIARDPLLAATVPVVVPLVPSTELMRDRLPECLREAVGDRLNEAIVGKVARNVASSWSQSGHLAGRTFKKRQLVRATPVAMCYALYLGRTAGFRGRELLTSGWAAILDVQPSQAKDLVVEAKRSGLIDFHMAGDVIEFGLDGLDPVARRR